MLWVCSHCGSRDGINTRPELISVPGSIEVGIIVELRHGVRGRAGVMGSRPFLYAVLETPKNWQIRFQSAGLQVYCVSFWEAIR